MSRPEELRVGSQTQRLVVFMLCMGVFALCLARLRRGPSDMPGVVCTGARAGVMRCDWVVFAGVWVVRPRHGDGVPDPIRRHYYYY